MVLFNYYFKGTVSVFVILIIGGILYFTILMEKPYNIKNIKWIINNDKNKSNNNLWRPFTDKNNQNIPDELFYNDRIGAQLEWVKKFFNTSGIEKLRGKRILLLFGKNSKFWGTDNEVNCPGFQISSQQCELKVSKNIRRLFMEHFDAVIYTQDFRKPKGIRVPENVFEIIYTEESPYQYFYKLEGQVILSSYYMGSDIVSPYSKWVSFNDEKVEYFNLERKKAEVPHLQNFASGKTKLAVMFASNCNTVYNDRFQYVEELKKYIAVDLFGNCGVRPPCNDSDSDSRDCLTSVIKKYKFYLAFENANCRSYITEKFFVNSLKNDVVPVVLGAHPEDYLHAAPPNSYINTEDFKSPKDLADYLTKVDLNDTLYNEYFQWKGSGQFYNSWKDLFCRICGMMFYADYFPPPKWKDKSTWDKGNMCLPKGQWHWYRTSTL